MPTPYSLLPTAYCLLPTVFCLLISLASMAYGQSAPWDPPIFERQGLGKPVRFAVESIPVSSVGPAQTLGAAIADRIAFSFKKTEPKLIILSVPVPVTSKIERIVQTVTDRFPRAVVVGLSSEANFTNRLENAQSAISAWAVSGGNIKISAALADMELDEFDSPRDVANYLHQTVLKTKLDKAYLVLSALDSTQTDEIVTELSSKEDNRIPVIAMTAPGTHPALFFASRRIQNGCAIISIAGSVSIDALAIQDGSVKPLSEKKNALEESNVYCQCALVCLPAVSDVSAVKNEIQKSLGKLTPFLVRGSQNAADRSSPPPAGTAILFSTPRN